MASTFINLKLFKKIRTFITHNPYIIPHLNEMKVGEWKLWKNLLFFACTLIAAILVIEEVKTYISTYYSFELKKLLNLIIGFLNNHCIINFLLTCSIFTCSYFWLNYIWNDRYLSLKRIGGTICLISILIYFSIFQVVESWIGIDYFAIITITFIMGLLIDFAKLWNFYWSQKPTDRRKVHFVTDTPAANMDIKVKRVYAGSIVDWLLNSDLTEGAFAVGITGDWGSGKSSFLEDLKTKFGKNTYHMIFEPWNCQGTDQIINEFFEQLRKTIKPSCSLLQKPILRYARLLTNIELPSMIKIALNFLPSMTYSISSYKKRIKSGLMLLDKPIVVAIDDIDRLESDELFEVLRLIRNTADFPNIIYIVCYDKRYVIKQIENKGIKEGDLYLEKIFPLELSLPMVESGELMEVLRRSLLDMSYLDGKIDWLMNSITKEDQIMIEHLLPTYRKVKRFARLLVSNTTFLTNQVGNKSFDVSDLFMLELIHYCIPELYDILKNKPDVFLAIDYDSETNVAKYVLNDNEISLGDKYLEYTGKQMNKYELQLVLRCFEIRNSNKTNRLTIVDTYPNYFCLGVPTNHIDKTEFNKTIANRSLIKNIVHDWFWKRPYKSNSSLYTRLMTVRMKELTIDLWKNHIDVLVFWMCEGDYHLTKNAFAKYLLIKSLKIENEKQIDYMKQYVYVRVDKAIKGRNVQYKNVAKALSGLYEHSLGHENDYLISQKMIINLLESNFDSFVSQKTTGQWDAINVVAINGNELNTLVKLNSVVIEEKDVFGGIPERICKNLIIPHVISFFNGYKEKSSHIGEAKRIYENELSKYKNKEMIRNINLKDEKTSVFGSEGDYYSKFISECFVDYEKKKYSKL